MFLSDPATADLVFTALSCAGLIAMGLLSLFVLPWTDEDIERVDQSARQLARQINERLISLGAENTEPPRAHVTTALR